MNIKNLLRGRALAVPVAVLVASTASLAALSSGAWFTDTDQISGNVFSTGTIDLDATPNSAAISLSNMAPGDVVVAPITVNNTGSVAMKYTMSGSATGSLAPALQTSVRSGVSSCSPAGFDATGAPVGAPNTVLGAKAALGTRYGVPSLASDVLCVKVALPGAATSNVYQNTSATLVFDFDGTQTTAP